MSILKDFNMLNSKIPSKTSNLNRWPPNFSWCNLLPARSTCITWCSTTKHKTRIKRRSLETWYSTWSCQKHTKLTQFCSNWSQKKLNNNLLSSMSQTATSSPGKKSRETPMTVTHRAQAMTTDLETTLMVLKAAVNWTRRLAPKDPSTTRLQVS